MPIVPVYLDVPEDIYKDILSGSLEVLGLVKDNNHRIRKHLPTVKQASKEGVVKALEVIKEHKGATIIVGGIIAAGIGTVATITYIQQNKIRKQKAKINIALKNYIDSTKSGNINTDIIDELLSYLDDDNNNSYIKLDEKQFSELIKCIYNYTISLAESNSLKVSLPSPKGNNIINLREYLNTQKEIISAVS